MLPYIFVSYAKKGKFETFTFIIQLQSLLEFKMIYIHCGGNYRRLIKRVNKVHRLVSEMNVVRLSNIIFVLKLS